MIPAKNLLRSLYLLVCVIMLSRCDMRPDNSVFRNTDSYNFASPKIINLPKELDEISGISYYPNDTSVFAIIDEDGILFKIPLKNPEQIRQWQFDKKRDFEDVVYKDSVFYVLVSNGDVEELHFRGNKIDVVKKGLADASKEVNEFESLYYNDSAEKIVMMCKDCQADKKKQISSFFLSDTSSSAVFFNSIDAAPIQEKLGGPRQHIKPSAAAVNPLTKELYVLCSKNFMLFINDARGNLKDVIRLNPKIYKQPEGITFTPAGDLVISNEAGSEGYATLLLLKNKKNH